MTEKAIAVLALVTSMKNQRRFSWELSSGLWRRCWQHKKGRKEKKNATSGCNFRLQRLSASPFLILVIGSGLSWLFCLVTQPWSGCNWIRFKGWKEKGSKRQAAETVGWGGMQNLARAKTLEPSSCFGHPQPNSGLCHPVPWDQSSSSTSSQVCSCWKVPASVPTFPQLNLATREVGGGFGFPEMCGTTGLAPPQSEFLKGCWGGGGGVGHWFFRKHVVLCSRMHACLARIGHAPGVTFFCYLGCFLECISDCCLLSPIYSHLPRGGVGSPEGREQGIWKTKESGGRGQWEPEGPSGTHLGYRCSMVHMAADLFPGSPRPDELHSVGLCSTVHSRAVL